MILNRQSLKRFTLHLFMLTGLCIHIGVFFVNCSTYNYMTGVEV